MENRRNNNFRTVVVNNDNDNGNAATAATNNAPRNGNAATAAPRNGNAATAAPRNGTAASTTGNAPRNGNAPVTGNAPRNGTAATAAPRNGNAATAAPRNGNAQQNIIISEDLDQILGQLVDNRTFLNKFKEYLDYIYQGNINDSRLKTFNGDLSKMVYNGIEVSNKNLNNSRNMKLSTNNRFNTWNSSRLVENTITQNIIIKRSKLKKSSCEENSSNILDIYFMAIFRPVLINRILYTFSDEAHKKNISEIIEISKLIKRRTVSENASASSNKTVLYKMNKTRERALSASSTVSSLTNNEGRQNLTRKALRLLEQQTNNENENENVHNPRIYHRHLANNRSMTSGLTTPLNSPLHTPRNNNSTYSGGVRNKCDFSVRYIQKLNTKKYYGYNDFIREMSVKSLLRTNFNTCKTTFINSLKNIGNTLLYFQNNFGYVNGYLNTNNFFIENKGINRNIFLTDFLSSSIYLKKQNFGLKSDLFLCSSNKMDGYDLIELQNFKNKSENYCDSFDCLMLLTDLLLNTNVIENFFSKEERNYGMSDYNKIIYHFYTVNYQGTVNRRNLNFFRIIQHLNAKNKGNLNFLKDKQLLESTIRTYYHNLFPSFTFMPNPEVKGYTREEIACETLVRDFYEKFKPSKFIEIINKITS